jgi:hypothetical protein
LMTHTPNTAAGSSITKPIGMYVRDGWKDGWMVNALMLLFSFFFFFDDILLTGFRLIDLFLSCFEFFV